MARAGSVLRCLIPVTILAFIDLMITAVHPSFGDRPCPPQDWLENLVLVKTFTLAAILIVTVLIYPFELTEDWEHKLERNLRDTVQHSVDSPLYQHLLLIYSYPNLEKSIVEQISADRAGLLPIQDGTYRTSPRVRYCDDRTSVLNNDGGSVTQTLQYPNVTTVVNNIHCAHPAQEQDTSSQLKAGTGKELSYTGISESTSTVVTADDLVFKKWPGPCPGAVTVPSGGEMITRHCSLGIDGFNLVTDEDGRVFLSYYTEEAAASLEFPNGVDSFPERGSVLFSFSKAGEEITTWTPFDSGRWDKNGKVVRVPPAWVP